MSRSSFYVVTFFVSGAQQVSHTYDTIRMARKLAAHIETFATDVRIMQGGPGGMEVQ